MAVEVEKLLVTLEANLANYNRNLTQAQGVTNAKLTAMEARFAKWSANLKNSTASAGAGITSMLGGIGAALGVATVIEYANAWTRTTRALDASGQVFGITLKSASELNALANDARVDLDAYSKLYIRTSAAIRDYGFEAGTAEKVTSTLAKALKLGGASASEQTSVLLQFSQALQKGKLDGDEFRTVMENAGVVQELLATRLNVTKGKIIELAAAGKLQIKDLVGAMVDGGDRVDRIFRQMPATIDEAYAVLRNNVIQFLGQADQATGASQTIAAGLVTISQNLGAVAVAAGAFLGSAAVRMAAFAAATVAAANPLSLIAAAIGGLATAYGVFGGEVSIAGDGIASLKDTFAAFIDVAGGNAAAILQQLADLFGAAREKAAEWGLTVDNLTGLFSSLGQGAADLDQKFGGFGAKIANAFIEGNKALADALGLTTALNAALETGNEIADRARQIALARGIAEKNLGGGLADAMAGKKNGPKGQAGPVTDPNAKRSQYEREVDQIKKRTEALRAEIATIGESEYAQNKAKAAAELRFAAAATAAKEGRKVTSEEIAAIDQLSSAYASAQAQAAFLAKMQGARENARALQDEIDLVGLYGQELTRAKVVQELLNEAKRQGAALTPELRAEISAIADKKSALQQQLDVIREVRDSSADALKSFIQDLRDGKSATEALGGALDKLATKLIDSGIDQLITSLIGGSSGGLGSLFGGSSAATTTGWATSVFPTFAKGGVSRGPSIFGEAGPEAAVPLPDGRRIPVDLRMPTAAKADAAQAAPSVTITIPIDARNSTPEAVNALNETTLPQLRKIIKGEVAEIFTRNNRFAKSGL